MPTRKTVNWIRLLKNIPLRFNEERSDQWASRHSDAWRRIYLAEEESIVCPDNALVIAIWRFHCFCRGGRKEMKDFLVLASNCHSLLDLGASAGIFSALFANTRPCASVLSVEPDELSFKLLLEAMEQNRECNPDWRALRAVVTNRSGTQPFRSTGFGGNISDSPDDEEVAAHTLETLATAMDFYPDIIKLDVESYEFEILTASLDWVAKHRPRLFLELHWELLLARGLSPIALLGELASLGYRCRGRIDFPKMAASQLDAAGVVRLPLVPV